MTTIFVAKLDFGVTENELKSLFEQYGNVLKVNIAIDRETSKPRGFAFVEMSDQADAQEAIRNLDNYSFNGRNCVVKEADARPDRSAPRPQRSEGGAFKPRTDSRPPRTDSGERPRFSNEAPPMRPGNDDDSDSSSDTPLKQIPKKKINTVKKVEIDTTNDGKSKKPKMNAYKKSGKDNQFFGDDDDLDEEIDLFGRSEDEDEDEDYSKYLVNSDDDDYDDDDYDDDDDDYEDDED